jgi:deoxyribose-phosphate aldolase
MKQFETLLDEAIKYRFAAVCVSPHVAVGVKEALKAEEDIKVCTVVAFPHGNLPPDLKFQQVKYFVDKGIDEIDFVINYGDLIWKHYDTISQELRLIGDYCSFHKVVSKCIVETCFLDTETLISIFNYIKLETRIDFIKTSTGFSDAGADVDVIRLWNELRGDDNFPRIKAAGGIKDLETALAMIEAGADRLGIGMSASVEVMEAYNNAQPTFAGGEEKAN